LAASSSSWATLACRFLLNKIIISLYRTP
jgi:hypothetical protein